MVDVRFVVGGYLGHAKQEVLCMTPGGTPHSLMVDILWGAVRGCSEESRSTAWMDGLGMDGLGSSPRSLFPPRSLCSPGLGAQVRCEAKRKIKSDGFKDSLPDWLDSATKETFKGLCEAKVGELGAAFRAETKG